MILRLVIKQLQSGLLNNILLFKGIISLLVRDGKIKATKQVSWWQLGGARCIWEVSTSTETILQNGTQFV